MPIVSADIKLKFSTTAGAAGNTNAGTPAGSLGKYISTTEITDNSLHNLFDVIAGDENAAGNIEYRAIFVHNAHATLTLQNTKAYLAAETAGGATIAIGVDPTAASAIGAAPAQAVQVANEDTAPAGVVFSAPTTIGTAVVLGDIPPGQTKALWVRRTATNSTALANDGVTLRIQGESL